MTSVTPRWLAGALLAVASVSPIARTPVPPPSALRAPPPTAQANDNRRPAGLMRGDTLFVDLDVRMARWYPEATTGAFVEAPMLGEVGRAPQVPGPLIRVREGTLIVARLTNALTDSTVTVRGLTTKPGLDSVKVPPGATFTLRFLAGAPGTYLYRATAGTVNWRDREREQLTAAFVVDKRGARTDDRIFVMNIWTEPDSIGPGRNALAINGRSWPYTERIQATTGDSLRWRIVNGTQRDHPMHLHGFYFTVLSEGRLGRDSRIPPADREHRVTYDMLPFSTMMMAWVPEREGNWLFHCHVTFHVIPDARLTPDTGHADHASADPTRHMAGLVMGIEVKPRGLATREVRANARAMRLHVQQGRPPWRTNPAFAFVLQQGAPPAPDSTVRPGSLLLLTRGQPTDITVINHLAEAAAVHWHGIELESYSDGVAGWSGAMNRLAPSVAPGDSFTARLTLKRAGTFIYHTHLNDVKQLTSGLYGPIVVLEPGQRMDPRTDHLFTVGWDLDSNNLRFMVNGDTAPPPMPLVAGVHHRMRFVFITPAEGGEFTVRADTTVLRWTPLARDGWPLPRSRQRAEPARILGWAGQTFDFDFVAPGPGTYRLLVGDPAKPDWEQKLVVR